MKGRNDPSTPLSAKLNSKNDSLNENDFDESGQENDIEIEEEIIYETPHKRPRKSYPAAKTDKNDITTTSSQQTIQYIISQDEVEQHLSDDQIVEIEPENSNVKPFDRNKKRSKGFGKYVASLMQNITEDRIFFDTQTEILKIIENATLKSPTK